MARQALKLNPSDPDFAVIETKKERRRARVKALRGKVFEDMDTNEKWKLVKELSVKMGLIDDSDD